MNNGSHPVPPLVLVLWQTPLLAEVVDDAVGDAARVVALPAEGLDIELLFQLLDPAVVVVETLEEARRARTLAGASTQAVLQIAFDDRRLRFFRVGASDEPAVGTASPEVLRTILVGSIHLRREEAPAVASAPPQSQRG